MKKLFITTVLAFLSISMFAQGTLQEGELQANAGLGFSSWGIPIVLGVDYGFTDEISLGGEISFRRRDYDRIDANYTHTGVGILAVGNYHFNNLLELPPFVDVYGGTSIGFYLWSSDNSQYKHKGNAFGYRIQVGGRYFFTEQWGINLEFGVGNFTDGRFGVTFKF